MKFLLLLLLAAVSCSKSQTHFTAEDFAAMGSPAHVVIPEGVTHIDDRAFWYAVHVKSVELPSTLTHIADEVFVYCSQIDTLKIPASVTHIGDGAFGRSDYITLDIEGDNFIVVDDILYDKDTTRAIRVQNIMREDFQLAPSTTHMGAYLFDANYSLRTIVIPPSVVSIGESCFNRAQNLHTVNIPSSLKSIAAEAFSTCSSLEQLTIPSSVESIGGGAFSRCNRLELTIDNERFIIENKLLLNADRSVVIANLNDNRGAADIPSGVKTIAQCAYPFSVNISDLKLRAPLERVEYRGFFAGRNLRRVRMDESVTFIGESAFNYSKALTTLQLSDNITYIGEYAFGNCEKLTELTLPSKLTHIGSKAFMNNYRILSVAIPACVSYIGPDAFTNCVELKEISVHKDSPLVKQLQEEYGDIVKII